MILINNVTTNFTKKYQMDHFPEFIIVIHENFTVNYNEWNGVLGINNLPHGPSRKA